MPDYSDWEFIFQEPWDVVTGEIPGEGFVGNDEFFPGDPLDQLAVVIRKSRELLEIDDASISAFEADPAYLSILRQLFGSTRSIYQYREYYKYAGFSERSLCEQVVESAKAIVPRETPGYTILAVYAIKEAWRQAKSLVQYDEAPDTAKALSLLREAERLAAEAELQVKNKELGKIHKGRSVGGSRSKSKRGIDLHILYVLRKSEDPKLVDRNKLHKGIPYCVDGTQYIEIEDGDWTFKISRDDDERIQHEATDPKGKAISTSIAQGQLYTYLKRVRRDYKNSKEWTLSEKFNWALIKDE